MTRARRKTDAEIRARVVMNAEQRRALMARVRSDPAVQKAREAALAAHPEFLVRRQPANGLTAGR